MPEAVLPPPTGTTTLVSQRVGGGFPGGPSAEASISAAGRYVAFTSGAADLVRGDVNRAAEVFVRDRRTGTTIRLPLPDGSPVPPGGQAFDPSISADGSVVAFTYQAPSGLSVVGSVVLAWDRATGRVTVVSLTRRRTSATGSREPSVSADGRFIAYTSDNALIVAKDANNVADVFRYDRRTGETVLISESFLGGPAPGPSTSPSISGDGNLVAFVSSAGDGIVSEDTGSGQQVYVRDVANGRTERISGAPGGGTGGAPADGESTAPSISADGRWVAFESGATNLVAGDGNGFPDVFRRDRTTGLTELVSVTPDGSPATGPSGEASISQDGRMVAFTSAAADVVAAVPGGIRLAAVVDRASEVFIRDMAAADTVRVSVAPDGSPGLGRSFGPAVAGNGRFIAFASGSDRLVDGDRNKVLDVFLRDLPPAPALAPPVLDFGTRARGSPATALAAVLRNAGWGPLSVTGASVAGAAKVDFPVSIDGCAKAVLHRGEACTVTVSFSPSAEGPRTATLQVADGFTGSPRTARLVGRGSQARLKLDPPVGPPGIVVVVEGSGFPPGAAVRLSWSPGITPSLPAVTADAAGRFRVQVLVFHNDRTGVRDLEAEPAGSVFFPPVAAPMLVSRPSVGPPGFLQLRPLLDLPLVLLIRG